MTAENRLYLSLNTNEYYVQMKPECTVPIPILLHSPNIFSVRSLVKKRSAIGLCTNDSRQRNWDDFFKVCEFVRNVYKSFC